MLRPPAVGDMLDQVSPWEVTEAWVEARGDQGAAPAREGQTKCARSWARLWRGCIALRLVCW